MKQIHDYIGKINLSDSNIGLADFSTQLNMAQSHINTLQYRIGNLGDRKVPKIQDALRAEEYINCICPSDWELFQIPE